jgi:hypothetical protein
MSEASDKKVVNIGRHSRQCGICNHAQRVEIERDFVAWRSPTAIKTEYGLSGRPTIYLHAHALGLFEKRQRNVRKALEHIIEQAGGVTVNAGAVVAAVRAYAKINSLGQWIDRSEHLDLNALFARMTSFELEEYAKDGTLPEWFCEGIREPEGAAVSITASDSDEDTGDEQSTR